jgi:hypothetical protein
MIAVKLQGGLGNQLFQLAAADTISAETGRTLCVTDRVSPKTVHTSENYFKSVFSEWNNCPVLPSPRIIVGETLYKKSVWINSSHKNLLLSGYFQNWSVVPPDFQSRIRLLNHPPLPGAFLHIRGGDYVNHGFHDIGLNRSYYQNAIEKFPAGTHFYVFTNDVEYAKQSPVLQTIFHTIVESDEITSLSQMVACTSGGICANSSFSWWGAYLNPDRTIVMPDKWSNDPSLNIKGYYFPGVHKCQV